MLLLYVTIYNVEEFWEQAGRSEFEPVVVNSVTVSAFAHVDFAWHRFIPQTCEVKCSLIETLEKTDLGLLLSAFISG